MDRRIAALTLLAGFTVLPACRADETARGYGGGDKTWVLQEIDGQSFSTRATLTFPEKGRIAGQAPCNSYFGEMTAPYPWFDASRVAATRMACPKLEAEQTFLSTLSEMSLSEISGDTMILSNDDGRSMVFRAD
ncbi:META domain-containing protein [Rhodobacteraceae bacterium 63075]|nr:META domain-containing protein [Rhodobacteraceae bacterium 63075]